MASAIRATAEPRGFGSGLYFAALVAGNVALALGPWSVRLADSGPIAAGFWRLALAVPLLALLARANRQPLRGFGRADWLAIGVAGGFFALDLASWHIGIGLTRLGNATLFANCGAIVLMVWGIAAARRLPRRLEAFAVLAAVAGAAILLGRSMRIDRASLIGDLLCIVAGLSYALYILLLQAPRARIGSWSLLTWTGLVGAPILLAAALVRGEPVWPSSWGPLIVLALLSQVIGQGLVIFSLKHLPPLLVGVTLLTEPLVAVLVGWSIFGEVLEAFDLAGMALISLALVLARLDGRPASSTAN